MVDSTAHLDVIDSVRVSPAVPGPDRDRRRRRPPARRPARRPEALPAAGHRRGRRPGPRRSPAATASGSSGAMTYEGQVAGLQDAVPDRSRPVGDRAPAQGAVAGAARRTAPRDRRRAARARRPGVLERRRLRLGRRRPRPTRSSPRSPPAPACWCRRSSTTTGRSSRGPRRTSGCRSYAGPPPQMVTVHGGGLVASGPAGPDRLPTPWAPAGLELIGLEGAGEVQTPLTGQPPTCSRSATWCGSGPPSRASPSSTPSPCTCSRAASSWTPCPTYRGCGQAF